MLAQIDLPIGGMTCPHCPPRVEEVLGKVEGVSGAHVNLANRVAHVTYDASRAKVLDLITAIRSAGYTAATARTRLSVANMHCGSCVIRIELELGMTPGVVKAEASTMTNAVDVEYQPERTSYDALKAAIARAGYRVVEPPVLLDVEADPEEAAQQAEYGLLMRKFWFAAVVSVPV